MKKIRCFLSFVLAVALVLGTVSVSAADRDTIAAPSVTWKGSTQADLMISTVKEFYQFADSVSNGTNYAGKVVRLTEDLDFTNLTLENFTMAGQINKPFKGTFDGAGHSIKGLNYNFAGANSNIRGTALFYQNEGTIKNLVLEDSDLKATSGYLAGIAVYNYGLIDNCVTKNTDIIGKTSVGGVVARNYETIRNCRNEADVISESNSGICGGITGYQDSKGKVYNCCNIGNVSSVFSATGGGYSIYVGGIVGENDEGGIQNCYNLGTVSSVYNRSKLGGIAGYCASASNVNNCIYAEDSCSQMIGQDKSNASDTSMSEDEMKTQDFADELNSHIATNDGWIPWRIYPTEAKYPVHEKVYRIDIPDISGGTVFVEEEYAYEGQTIEVAVGADKGYEEIAFDVLSDGVPIPYAQTANGYEFVMPDSSVTISADFSEIIKQEQVITGTAVYEKKYGDAGFYLDAVSSFEDAVLVYSSSNKKVVTVDSNGKVTINGAGDASITVTAMPTDYYEMAKFVVTIHVTGTNNSTSSSTNKNTNTSNKNDTSNATVSNTTAPAKTKIKKVTSQKRQLKISWNKVSGVTGYQVQVSANKTFKNAAKRSVKGTNTVVSKLKKGKRYYVRVRAYKTVNGGKIYGKWSPVKRSKAVK